MKIRVCVLQLLERGDLHLAPRNAFPVRTPEGIEVKLSSNPPVDATRCVGSVRVGTGSRLRSFMALQDLNKADPEPSSKASLEGNQVTI